jgi:hypothetical protein
MPVLDLNLDKAPDIKAVEPGEYRVRIESVEIKTSQKGNEYISVRMTLPDEKTADDVYHMLMLPSAEDDEKTSNKRLSRLKKFCEWLDVPLKGKLNTEDWQGREGWVHLTTEDDPEYGERNRVQKLGRPA